MIDRTGQLWKIQKQGAVVFTIIESENTPFSKRDGEMWTCHRASYFPPGAGLQFEIEFLFEHDNVPWERAPDKERLV